MAIRSPSECPVFICARSVAPNRLIESIHKAKVTTDDEREYEARDGPATRVRGRQTWATCTLSGILVRYTDDTELGTSSFCNGRFGERRDG